MTNLCGIRMFVIMPKKILLDRVSSLWYTITSFILFSSYFPLQDCLRFRIVGNLDSLWYQVLYDNNKTGYINSNNYSGHTVNEKPTINANADVSDGRATVSGNVSLPAWMTLKSAQINSDIGCHMISNLDGGSSYRMTLPGTFSAGTHSLTAKVYSTYQFAKNGKLEKGSCESNGYSFKVTVPSEQNPANPAVVAQTAAENNITKTALMVIGDCLGNDYELSRLYAPDFSTEFRKASK